MTPDKLEPSNRQLSKVKINDQQNQLPFVVDFQPAASPV